ncbi:MAG: BrnT family toxin [Chloroflexia bacterium]
MYVDGFIWLPQIIEKLEVKHNITQDETEEVFFNNPKYRRVESSYNHGEDVYSASGRTDGGRYVIVFFIHKQDNSVFILSARDMDKNERKRYEQK